MMVNQQQKQQLINNSRLLSKQAELTQNQHLHWLRQHNADFNNCLELTEQWQKEAFNGQFIADIQCQQLVAEQTIYRQLMILVTGDVELLHDEYVKKNINIAD